MEKVNHNQLQTHLRQAWKTKIPVMIWGGAGIGKSDAVRDFAKQLAKELKLEYMENGDEGEKKLCFRDIRLSQLESVDLRGIPKIEEGRTKWFVPDWLPQNPDSSGILFFDEANRAFLSVMNACLIGDTIVGGEEYKKISDLTIGDKVIDKNGNLQKITEIKKRFYSGNLFTIKATNLVEIKATSEHPFLIIDKFRRENKKWNIKNIITQPRWIEAKDLKEGMYVGIPILKGNDETKEITISQRGNIKKTIKLDEDFARFLGYFVGDGYHSKGQIGICLGDNEKDKHKEVIDLIRKCFGHEARIRNQGKMKIIGFCRKELGEKIGELCGKRVYVKKIPSCILYNKNIEILRNFLIGYFKADGFVYNKYYNFRHFAGFTTVSKNLALQVQQAFTRFGLFATIRVNKAKDFKIRGKIAHGREAYIIQSCLKEAFDVLDLIRVKPRIRPTYYFFEHEGKLWVKIKQIERSEYSNFVYNCEVENTHSYVANNYITHNCLELFLDKRIGSYHLPKKWLIILAGNPYEAQYQVNQMSAPLRNRFKHFELQVPTIEEWSAWGIEHDINPNIVAFLNFRPNYLYKMSEDNRDESFPTPRTWFFGSRSIDGVTDLKFMEREIASCVGKGVAMEFSAWYKMHDKVDLDAIIKAPETVKKIKEMSLKFSVVAGLAEKYKSNKDIFEAVMTVCKFIEPEFGYILLGYVKSADRTAFSKKIVASKVWKEVASIYGKFVDD